MIGERGNMIGESMLIKKRNGDVLMFAGRRAQK